MDALIRDVLDHHIQNNPIAQRAFEVEFRLSQELPTLSYSMQHESDRQYVERLIAQYGLFYFFEFKNDDGHPVMIGEKGDMSDLQRRTAVAAASAATFFLSVHHDSVQPQYLASWDWRGSAARYSDRFSGFSLFVSRKNAALDASLRCASAIGAALRRVGLQPSSHHAENISGENKEWADERNGVYYYDNLAVLRTATMPAVLLEAGIIVNRDEEERLQQPAMRSTIANAVAEGGQSVVQLSRRQVVRRGR